MEFAFLFPGQGSQSFGMMHQLAKEFPVVKQTFIEASDAINVNLLKIINDKDGNAIHETVNTQPIVLTSSCAVWRIWKNLSDQKPAMVSGHSLGEYSALAYAGSFRFCDAVRLVRKRAQLMQSAVPAEKSQMAAVLGLESNEVEKVCTEINHGKTMVEVVNYNSPNQLVIAGYKEAVARAAKQLCAAGAKKIITLPVSVPAHSSLMKDAANRMFEFLSEVNIKQPAVKILHNVNALACSSVGEIRQILKRQLCEPVQWLKIIRQINSEGIEKFIEIGPGRVLCGLTKRIDKTLSTQATDTPESLLKAVDDVA